MKSSVNHWRPCRCAMKAGCCMCPHAVETKLWLHQCDRITLFRCAIQLKGPVGTEVSQRKIQDMECVGRESCAECYCGGLLHTSLFPAVERDIQSKEKLNAKSKACCHGTSSIMVTSSWRPWKHGRSCLGTVPHQIGQVHLCHLGDGCASATACGASQPVLHRFDDSTTHSSPQCSRYDMLSLVW